MQAVLVKQRREAARQVWTGPVGINRVVREDQDELCEHGEGKSWKTKGGVFYCKNQTIRRLEIVNKDPAYCRDRCERL